MSTIIRKEKIIRYHRNPETFEHSERESSNGKWREKISKMFC